jgi:hypothetical protein
MSAPIDIPQNINLHLTHTEKVVQTPKAESHDNSSYQFSFELQNKAPGSQRQEQIIERKRRSLDNDSYEGQSREQEDEKNPTRQEDNQNPPQDNGDEPKILMIGKNLDVSI